MYVINTYDNVIFTNPTRRYVVSRLRFVYVHVSNVVGLFCFFASSFSTTPLPPLPYMLSCMRRARSCLTCGTPPR